jgi:hypothetical protein
MKTIQTLCFIAMLFSVLSCKKEESQPSYADAVAGTYHGTTYYGASHLPCTAIITKTANTKVELTITTNGSSFSFGEIAVFKTGDNFYSLSLSDQSGYLDGAVTGNTLNYSITSGVQNSTFTGTR